MRGYSNGSGSCTRPRAVSIRQSGFPALRSPLPKGRTDNPLRKRLLERLAAGRPVRLDATGEEAALTMRFPAAPRLAPAARAMFAHCPRSDTANLR